MKSFCGGSRGAFFSKRPPLAAGGKKINRFNGCSLFCWVIVGVLLFLSNPLNSQATGEKHMKGAIIQKNAVEPDPVLIKLKNQLPDNWSMHIENERLIVKCNEPAYRKLTNLINAPAGLIKKEQREKQTSAEKEGIEVYCKFVFQLETRWFPERLERARNINKSIDREISQLSKKYNITNLYNRASKTVAGLYRGKTPEEKRRIAAFEKEKKELMKKRVRLPDYVSRDFCLFLLEKEGMQDEYTLIYPEEASQEMYRIENKFKEIFEVWR